MNTAITTSNIIFVNVFYLLYNNVHKSGLIILLIIRYYYYILILIYRAIRIIHYASERVLGSDRIMYMWTKAKMEVRGSLSFVAPPTCMNDKLIIAA